MEKIINELTPQQAAHLLSFQKQFASVVRQSEELPWQSALIVGVINNNEEQFITSEGKTFRYCGQEVKPKPQPFKREEDNGLEIGDILYYKPDNQFIMITGKNFYRGQKNKPMSMVLVDGSWVGNSELFTDFTKKDGSLIGKAAYVPVRQRHGES